VNFKYAQYYRNPEAGPLPGWDLPAGWLVEKGVPMEGWVGFQYYAGEGKRLQGCRVCDRFRRSLLQMVLIDEREIDKEVREWGDMIDFDAEVPHGLTIGEHTLMTDRQGDDIGDMWLDYLTISQSYNYYRKVVKT
jgi:hypothetical protein